MGLNDISCAEFRVISDAAARDALWDVYIRSFADAGTACIQEQLCYTKEMFEDALLDPAYVKFVATADGAPSGFLMCTNDLEKARVAYVNPKRLAAEFPDHAGRIYYYTAIAVTPDLQGNRLAALLVASVAELMDREDAVSAFDYSLEKNPRLPDMIVRATEAAQRQHPEWRTNKAAFSPLGGQMYGFVKLSRG